MLLLALELEGGLNLRGAIILSLVEVGTRIMRSECVRFSRENGPTFLSGGDPALPQSARCCCWARDDSTLFALDILIIFTGFFPLLLSPLLCRPWAMLSRSNGGGDGEPSRITAGC